MACSTINTKINVDSVPPAQPILPMINATIIMFLIGIFGDNKDNQISCTNKSVKILVGSLDRVKRTILETVNLSGTFAKKEDVFFLLQYVEEHDRDLEVILQVDCHRT